MTSTNSMLFFLLLNSRRHGAVFLNRLFTLVMVGRSFHPMGVLPVLPLSLGGIPWRGRRNVPDPDVDFDDSQACHLMYSPRDVLSEPCRDFRDLSPVLDPDIHVNRSLRSTNLDSDPVRSPAELVHEPVEEIGFGKCESRDLAGGKRRNPGENLTADVEPSVHENGPGRFCFRFEIFQDFV